MNQVEWCLRRALASATHRTVCLGVIVAGLMPASALAQVRTKFSVHIDSEPPTGVKTTDRQFYQSISVSF
jgi:hypothetical protein